MAAFRASCPIPHCHRHGLQDPDRPEVGLVRVLLLRGWLSTQGHSERCRGDQVGREDNGALLRAEPFPLTLQFHSFSRATCPQTPFIPEALMAQPRPLAWKQAITQPAQHCLPARRHTGPPHGQQHGQPPNPQALRVSLGVQVNRVHLRRQTLGGPQAPPPGSPSPASVGHSGLPPHLHGAARSVQAVLGACSPRASQGSPAAGCRRQVGAPVPCISRGLCGSASTGRGTLTTRAGGESKGPRPAGLLPGSASVELDTWVSRASAGQPCGAPWMAGEAPSLRGGRSLGPDPPRLCDCWLGVTPRRPRHAELWVQPHFCASGDNG